MAGGRGGRGTEAEEGGSKAEGDTTRKLQPVELLTLLDEVKDEHCCKRHEHGREWCRDSLGASRGLRDMEEGSE